MRALPPLLRPHSGAEVAERLQAERRGTPYLLFRDGEARQRIVDLGGADPMLSVGRQASTDVPLDWDAEVSRVHALLERVGDEWTVIDDGLSRNGSFVNGSRIRGRRRLAGGDLIGVGSTVLAYLAGGEEEALTTATARESASPALSPAQVRVLTALCRPLAQGPFAASASNREIAAELVVSVDTVKSHLRRLFELFEIDDLPQNRKRAELARRALDRGAIPPL